MNVYSIESAQDKTYALAPNPIFWTIQGEGHLRGFQMLFIRLAGCSVGCDGCDTNYSVDSRKKSREIAEEANAATPASARDRWVWITGGEPLDHDLVPLMAALRECRFSIAVATSGHKRLIPPVDWISVSPHDPRKLLQTYGSEIKVVHGLNGMDFADFHGLHPDSQTDFMYRYVQPLSVDGSEDPSSLRECLRFLRHNPNWSLSRQDHIYWGVK